MQALYDYIREAEHLLPAPQVLPQILPLLNQPDADVKTVVDLIAYNQTLTGNVLRVCNSACFSRGTPIDSLQHAVAHLGFRQIYDIVVSVVSVVALARPQKGYGVEANELWNHSVATAVAAQIVARDCSEDQQIAFTAGILHDIGKIVLSLALEDVEDKVAFESAKRSLTPYEFEMELLGVNHAEVGGRLLEHWKLPEHLVGGVRYHHDAARANGNKRLAACVHVGNFIAYLMGYGYGKYLLDFKAHGESLEILNLTPESTTQYKHEIQQTHRLTHFRQLYNVK
jgi:putative nucleotidyltransferase with HDIG domain